MDNEHARAKDAYDKIKKVVEENVPAADLTALPKGASSLLWLKDGKLFCNRSITKAEMKRLKDLSSGDSWEKALKDIQTKYGKEAYTTLKTWALKVPSMLQNEGLLQTLAVLQDKFIDKDADGKNVYWLLSEWLLGSKPGSKPDPQTGSTKPHVPWPEKAKKKIDLMDAINALEEGDQEVFRFAHREAIAYMIWVKRAVSVNLAGVGLGG